MPAKSKTQQRFMGAALAAKRGEKPISKKVGDVAKSMSSSELEKFAGTKHKGLPKKVKKEQMNGTIDTVYMVKRPYSGCTLSSLVQPIDPLVGIGAGHEVVPDQVYATYADQELANQAATELYEEYCKMESMLEEKKGKVTDKIKITIDKLEKKRKEHISAAKEDPKNSKEHRQKASEITTKIDELMDKLEKIEKSKKTEEKKEKEDKK